MTQSAKTIRVLLVEDHLVMRTALRLLLSSQPDLQVVGEAGDQPCALTLATQEQPDIILLDLFLKDGDSFEFIPTLCAAAPRAGVLVLTGTPDPQLHRRAITQGAMGLVLKEQPAEVLLEAIARVCAGEVWIDRALLSIVFAAPPQTQPGESMDGRIGTLTEREREVIALIGEGLRNKELASRLFLSERTVHNHLASIFRKLDVCDRLELAVFAHRHGLLSAQA